MSLNLIPLKTVGVIDPRLNYNSEKKFSVLLGPKIVNWQVQPAQSPIGSTVTFNVILPGRQIAISRKVLVQYNYTTTVTGTNTSGGPLLNANFVAPRSYPFQSSVNNAAVTIGGATITQSQLNTYFNQIQWYKQRVYDENNQELSTAPIYPDQAYDYSVTAMSLRNPLGNYQDSTSLETGRGGFSGFSIAPQAPNNTSATVTLIGAEEIFLSPFDGGRGSDSDYAMIGLDVMTWTFTMDLSRFLSIQANQGTAGTINVTGVSTVLTSANMIIQTITPPDNIERPTRLAVPYANYQRYQTQGPVVVPGQTNFTIVANSIQVNAVPRLMFIYGSRADASRTSFQTDAVLPLTGANSPGLSFPLKLQWNNNQFFAQSSTYNLYLMCVRNGLQMSYTQWSKFVGSVLMIDIGAGDLGLDQLQSPSVLESINLQITASFDNLFLDASVQTILNVILVYDGVANIVEGQMTLSPSILSHEDVSRARVNNNLGVYEKTVSVSGGSVLGDLAKGVSKVLAPLVPQQFKGVERAAKSIYCDPSVRQALCGGCGDCGHCGGGAASGGRRKKRGGAAGGALMSKSELERMLRD